MALIKCPECGREKVSDKAPLCPGCGYVFYETENKDSDTLKNRQKKSKFIIPIATALLIIILVSAIVMILLLPKITNQKRINECLEITKESIGKEGTIQEIYYYEPSNSCIVLLKYSDGDEDQETVNLNDKTYGKRSTYALYAFTIGLAEKNNKTEGLDILYDGISEYGFDVLLSYEFDTNPKDFKLIYKNK